MSDPCPETAANQIVQLQELVAKHTEKLEQLEETCRTLNDKLVAIFQIQNGTSVNLSAIADPKPAASTAAPTVEPQPESRAPGSRTQAESIAALPWVPIMAIDIEPELSPERRRNFEDRGMNADALALEHIIRREKARRAQLNPKPLFLRALKIEIYRAINKLTMRHNLVPLSCTSDEFRRLGMKNILSQYDRYLRDAYIKAGLRMNNQQFHQCGHSRMPPIHRPRVHRMLPQAPQTPYPNFQSIWNPFQIANAQHNAMFEALIHDLFHHS